MKKSKEPNEPKPAPEKEPPKRNPPDKDPEGNITPLDAPTDPDTAQKKEIKL